MKIAIYVTSYCETEKRHALVTSALLSLVKHSKAYDLIFVNDGSVYEKHSIFLENLVKDSDRDLVLISQKNFGVAIAKNTCIKHFIKNNYDFGFLVDDDLFYTRDIFKKYLEGYKRTGIHHFSLFVDAVRNKQHSLTFNGFNLIETEYINGCFLTITRPLIYKIGGFKILPYKFGHEHSDFSIRARRSGLTRSHWYDIQDTSGIRLVRKSFLIKSISNLEREKMRLNLEIVLKSKRLFEPIIVPKEIKIDF